MTAAAIAPAYDEEVEFDAVKLRCIAASLGKARLVTLVQVPR
jgi:hypothetical protein